MANSQVRRIAAAGLLVAALDFLSITVLWALIRRAVTVLGLAQTIVTGLPGKAAYEGGTGTAVLGVLLHVLVGFSWTVVF